MSVLEHGGYGEYISLALCGWENECARTDTVFFPASEVSKGKVSLDNLVIGLL